jgi:hypothetical protein
VTTALLDSPQPWSLACATSPRRLRRCAAVVLDLHWPQLSAELLTALAPHLRPESPPLCLPLAPGVALAGHPGSTSTFGELRCRLVAAALRRVPDGADPLPEIAALFRAHGIDPATPYRQRPLPGA